MIFSRLLSHNISDLQFHCISVCIKGCGKDLKQPLTVLPTINHKHIKNKKGGICDALYDHSGMDVVLTHRIILIQTKPFNNHIQIYKRKEVDKTFFKTLNQNYKQEVFV